jgi:hypothetical protein|uniref:Uncharacterized protein n=1 Tax=viral metagenome TaxID=1070528 RepID=A0A6C0IU50_9ZZZZ
MFSILISPMEDKPKKGATDIEGVSPRDAIDEDAIHRNHQFIMSEMLSLFTNTRTMRYQEHYKLLLRLLFRYRPHDIFELRGFLLPSTFKSKSVPSLSPCWLVPEILISLCSINEDFSVPLYPDLNWSTMKENIDTMLGVCQRKKDGKIISCKICTAPSEDFVSCLGCSQLYCRKCFMESYERKVFTCPYEDCDQAMGLDEKDRPPADC